MTSLLNDDEVRRAMQGIARGAREAGYAFEAMAESIMQAREVIRRIPVAAVRREQLVSLRVNFRAEYAAAMERHLPARERGRLSTAPNPMLRWDRWRYITDGIVLTSDPEVPVGFVRLDIASDEGPLVVDIPLWRKDV